MTRTLSRRRFSSSFAIALAGLPLLHSARLSAEGFSASEIAPFRTPYKYGKLVLAASDDPNAFDCIHDRFRGKVPSRSFGHHFVHGPRSLHCASIALQGRPGIRKSIRGDPQQSDYRQPGRSFVGCRGKACWFRHCPDRDRHALDWPQTCGKLDVGPRRLRVSGGQGSDAEIPGSAPGRLS